MGAGRRLRCGDLQPDARGFPCILPQRSAWPGVAERHRRGSASGSSGGRDASTLAGTLAAPRVRRCPPSECSSRRRGFDAWCLPTGHSCDSRSGSVPTRSADGGAPGPRGDRPLPHARRPMADVWRAPFPGRMHDTATAPHVLGAIRARHLRRARRTHQVLRVRAAGPRKLRGVRRRRTRAPVRGVPCNGAGQLVARRAPLPVPVAEGCRDRSR